MGKLSVAKMVCTVLVFCAAAAIGSRAQTFTTLVSFDGADGAEPLFMSLIQGPDGNFYGTTSGGGASSDGTVFKITSAGTLTTLHSFDGTDGSTPYAGLVQATGGNFYGTTYGGGAHDCVVNGVSQGCGTVFEITPAGALTTLYSFCAQTNCSDGVGPVGGLVQGTDGNFYGITGGGGAYSAGTVFKITPAGTLTTLYSFCAQSGCTDGGYPAAGLVQGTDGSFYGTTSAGGTSNGCAPHVGCGAVFKITPAGTLTTLYSFCSQTGCTDGSEPWAGLVQGTDGNFYGTTAGGGVKGNYGTVFKITPAGTLTTLHSFDGTDGSSIYAGLVQATDGNFYGTTAQGGASGYGTVFEITAGGTLATLHSFAGEDGAVPYVGLVQATNGYFYGATSWGGTSGNCSRGCGAVLSLNVGLAPFVETQPTSGAVGAAVIILGNNLTGATSVSFNGTLAKFTVVSSSEIETTVPAGATTGPVQVTTPSGTLDSNVPFYVTTNINISSGENNLPSFFGLFFGTQLLATPSAARTVILTNSGGSAVTINNIVVAGANSGDFGVTHNCPISPNTLAADNSCTLQSTFAPQAAGPRKSSISISDNAGSGVQTIYLTGVGAAISTVPSSLSFSSEPVGTPSAAMSVVLANEGNTNVSLYQITFIGANAGDFSQSNSTCGNSLGAGGKCTVNVTFTPAAAGSRTASLMISNDGGGSPQAVALAGTGTAGAAVRVTRPISRGRSKEE